MVQHDDALDVLRGTVAGRLDGTADLDVLVDDALSQAVVPDERLVGVVRGGLFVVATDGHRAVEAGAREIVERALGIAADICIYTNRSLVIEGLRS